MWFRLIRSYFTNIAKSIFSIIVENDSPQRILTTDAACELINSNMDFSSMEKLYRWINRNAFRIDSSML